MYPTDTAKLSIELSAFDKALNLSVIDGSSCFLTKVSPQTAREFAESILDILEDMDDAPAHGAQTALQFNAHMGAA